MTGLLKARCRYAALRARLAPGREIDRALHAELTRTIRALDDKIGRALMALVSADGPAEAAPGQAHRRRSER